MFLDAWLWFSEPSDLDPEACPWAKTRPQAQWSLEGKASELASGFIRELKPHGASPSSLPWAPVSVELICLALTVWELRWSFLIGVCLHYSFSYPLWALYACHLNAELRENWSREQA